MTAPKHKGASNAVQTIPLSKLHLSAANVRKTVNEDADTQLSHDIEARGLLQNLIVTKAKKRGHFDVIAGGRRLRAMNQIVERKGWKAATEISCKVLESEPGDSTETSLAENFQRMAMTPAEECRAFQHFTSQDGDVEAVALRFGITRRFVEGRLRLASLADPIFEELAAGKMTLDLAKAYASTDQHEVQLRVFEQMNGSWQSDNPDTVRRMIADGSVRGNDPLALLVTEDRYVAAGGKVERDLFNETADDRWLDIEILHKLADETMQAEAKRLLDETGIAWVRPIAGSSSYNVQHDLGVNPVHLPPAPIGEDASTRIDAIQTRMEQIGETIDALAEDDEEGYDTLQSEYDDIDREMREISNPKADLPEEWKPEVGTFLLVSTAGEMVLEGGYFSEKQLKMERDDDGNVTGGSFEEPVSRGSGSKAPASPEATAPGGKPVSAKLFDELAVQRRNILSASLLGDPGLAMDFAIFSMADKPVLSYAEGGYDGSGTTIKAGHPNDPVLSSNVPKSLADDYLAGAYDNLEKGWTEPRAVADRFAAFRALDDETKAAWLAYVVATSLEAKKGYSSEYHPIHAMLGTILNIEPATMWRPTAENFFDRIAKGSSLDLLKEVGGADLANRYSGSKKGEIATSCEKIFAGDTIIEDDIKERALAWVPAAMQFTVEEADPEPEPDADADADVDTGESEAENDDDTNVNDEITVDEEATVDA